MDEFDDITRLLREERPQASELELDEIKRRVRQRVARKGQPMRSRLAILAMLVAGMLLSGTGAGLAVQGFDQSGNDASQAQYPSGGGSEVLGEEESSGPVSPQETDTVENDTAENDTGENDTAQVAQQVESGDTLPFTGFAAIPVVLAGVALIGGGLMLRRQSPSGD
jgi:hypothetical protein